MSLPKRALVCLAAIIGILSCHSQALAAGDTPSLRSPIAKAVERPARSAAPSFRLAVEKKIAQQQQDAPPQKSVKRQKCEALNECRKQFTLCYDEIYRNPKKSWETHENDCAIPYSDCIDKNFKMGEMWFTRMFNPFVLKCEKY